MQRPQWTMIILCFLSIVIAGYLHGKPRNETRNVGKIILSEGITLFILYMGGFFNH